MHWLYKHGPYEIIDTYTIICSCKILLSPVVLIQSVNDLQCKSHLLKETIQTALPLEELDAIYTLGNAATWSFLNVYTLQYLHKASYLVLMTRVSGKQAEFCSFELLYHKISDVPNCFCFAFSLADLSSHLELITLLIWKLMHNTNCIILLTVSVSACIMLPLLY